MGIFSRLLFVAACSLLACFNLNSALAADGIYVVPVVSMKFRGAWNASLVYSARDIAFYNGSSWLSLAGNNKGNTPNASSAKWSMLVQKGSDGVDGARGATGPQGPAGPAVRTYAVCVQGGIDGCNCNGARELSKVKADGTGHCTATSDTGSCVAYGVAGKKSECCVCAPN